MTHVQSSLRSAGWVSLWSLAQLVIQFAFQVVIAKYFGAAAEMDAFVAALALPTVFSSIFVASLGYAFVPVFSQRLQAGDAEGAWATAHGLLALLVATCGIAAGVMFLGAEPLTRVLFPGFRGAQAELTVSLVGILCWLVVSNALLGYSQAIHHCHRRFAIPAFAPVIGTGLTLAVTLLFRDRGMIAVGWAVLLGSVVAAGIQMVFPLRQRRFRPRWDDGTKRCLRLLLPLACGAAYYRLDPLVDRYLASGLAIGSVAHLGYASRIMSALLVISTSGLSIVAFPSLAVHGAAGQLGEFRAEAAHTLRCLSVILVPLLVGLGCYSGPVVHDLLERGHFTDQDAHAVATLLVLYLGFVAGAALGEITAKIFYALSDTRTPTVIGCLGFTGGVALKIILTSRMGVAGIVIGTSVYFLMNAVLMLWLIVRRLGFATLAGTGAALVRALLAAAAATVAVAPIVLTGLPFASFIAAPCGGLVYFVVLLLLHDEFACRLRDYLLPWRHP